MGVGIGVITKAVPAFFFFCWAVCTPTKLQAFRLLGLRANHDFTSDALVEGLHVIFMFCYFMPDFLTRLGGVYLVLKAASLSGLAGAVSMAMEYIWVELREEAT